ncbi:MAG: oligosaccharide flippase family protein [Elusimicrobiaceae bacterium]|nr:oligosaccharide flippase family protein [Elusimicrobiaceae bacterium]
MIANFFGRLKYGPVVFWSFAAKGSALVLFYAFQVYLARKAGTSVYGQWNLFYSVFSILAIIANCGINFSSQKHMAQHDGTDRLASVFGSALVLRFCVSAAFMAAWFVLAGPLAAALGRRDLAPFIAAAAPAIFLAGHAEFFKEVFIGLRLIRNNFIINTLEYGLKLVFTIAALRIFAGLLPVVWAFALALLVTVLAGLLLARARIKEPWKFSAGFAGSVAVYALPLLVYEISNTLLSETDTVILGMLKGNHEVGVYSMAKQLLVKAPHLAVAISMGIMPAFARLDHANRAELKKLLHSLLKLNTVISGLLAGAVLIFADAIMSTLFGAAGAASANVLRVMCGYMVFSLFTVYSVSFLRYTGQAGLLAVNMLAAIAADVFLMLLLAPSLGALGAAISVSVSYGVFASLNFIAVHRALR